MDNASNNDTFVSELQSTLTQRGIEFSGSNQRIRYSIYNIFININLIFSLNSCFSHIVNLACKAMLNAWSGTEFDTDPIRKLRGVIQRVSIFIFINKILLNVI